MKKLLVGSIFADDSDYQQKLLDIQLRFLHKTTDDFDHVVVLSRNLSCSYFESKTKVIVLPDTTLQTGEAHLAGLKTLIDYFQSVRADYSNFLILDSDAFPIKKDWMPQLLSKMQARYLIDDHGNFLALIERGYEIAALLRSENLETRLHAAVLFFSKPHLDRITFEYRSVGNDLAGRKEIDICIPVYQFERRQFAFPLIRSNKTQVHPLACGVYYDAFYHHAAGSRHSTFRGDEYWKPYYKSDESYIQEFLTDPENFIQKLAGWNVY